MRRATSWILIGVALAAGASPAAAQEGWRTNADWVTDYEEALDQATEQGEVVLGFFSRPG